MAKRSRSIPMAPSLKGVDQQGPAYGQPDLTMPYSVNLTTRPAVGGRARMGKRDGMRRAFENAAGGGAPITGLAAAQRAGQDVQQTNGTFVPFTDGFSTYDFLTTRYQGFWVGNELKGNWARMSKKPAEYGVNGWQGGSTLPGTWIGVVRGGGLPDHLQLRSTFADGYDLGATIMWDTGNTLALTQNCYRRATDADMTDCHNVGPYVRGHPANGFYVWAYLKKVATNQVRLVIEGCAGAALTTLAQSDLLTLSGRGVLSSNCKIELRATTVALEATLEWADEPEISGTRIGSGTTFGYQTQWVSYTGATGAFEVGELITQATTNAVGYVVRRVEAGGTGFVELYVKTGTFTHAGAYTLTGATNSYTATTAKASSGWVNRRGGLWFKNPGGTPPAAEAGFFYRRVTLIQGAKRVTAETELIAEAFGTSKLAAGDRYQILPNWESYRIDGGAGSVARIIAGRHGFSSSVEPDACSIDTTDKVVLGNTSGPPITDIMTIEVWGDGSPPDEHLDVRQRLRDVTTTEDDRIGAAFALANLHA